MKTADWIVVAVFLASALLLAVVTAVRMRSPDEYFTAGRRTRRFMLILFAFGSGTSSDSQSSVMAGTWRSGLSGLWWQFLWLPITPFYWIVAPLLRRLRAITTADFFAMRFGPSTAGLYSVYGMVISVVLMAGVLFGGARILDTLTDPVFSDLSARWNVQVPVVDLKIAFQPPANDRPSPVTWRPLASEEIAAVALSVLMLIVAGIGGLGSAIIIDAFQGLLRVVLTFVLLRMVFTKIGDFGGLNKMESIKPGMLDFVANSDAAVAIDHEPFTPFYLCVLSLAALAGIIVQPHIITICGSGRSEMDSRIGFTFGNLLKRCMSVAWAFIGLACIVWYLGPSSPLQGANATPEQQQLMSDMKTLAAGTTEQLSPEQLRAINTADLAFADRILGRIAREILQGIMPGLLGLVVAMILASAISHCGTQMIVGSGLFAEHLYRHYIAPGHSPRHYLAVGRICGPVLILIALLLQMSFTNITDVLKLVIKTPAVIGISMWMGLVWTRWNTISVWATTVTAAVLGIICGYYPEEIQKTLPALSSLMFFQGPDGLNMIDAWKIVCILSGGFFVGIVATMLSDPQPDDQLEHFYRVLRTPVSPGEEKYGDQYSPSDDEDLAPAISFFGFQLPGPTLVGTVGFVVAWVIVIGIVLLTKRLSLLL